MKCIYASFACCARVIKEGIAMMQQHHNIIFLQQTMANWDMLKALPLTTFYGDPFVRYSMPREFKNKIGVFGDIDLIHVHNEPSWLGYAAKEACPDIPVIFDAHDLDAVRYGTATEDERRSIGACDAVIFPSQGYRDFCLNLDAFTVPLNGGYTSIADKPTAVVYSMCNDHAVQATGMPRVPGIVYQGAVSIGSDYRDYRRVSSTITKMGIPFHVYPATPEFTKEYTRTGAICTPTLPYMTMMKDLTRYDWGFVGSPIESQQWHKAMPNKLFEYIAAGIPCLVYQADEAADFVTEHELGVVIQDLEDIPTVYDQHEHFRETVREKRHLFTMTSQVPILQNLYEQVRRNQS